MSEQIEELNDLSDADQDVELTPAASNGGGYKVMIEPQAPSIGTEKVPDDVVEFIREMYEDHGFGMPTIVKNLEANGIEPVRGKRWYNPVVLQLVKRHGFVKGERETSAA